MNRTGRLGFILPHKVFNAQYGEPLRKLIADGKHLAEVVHFGDQQIFEDATTYTCLLFLEKSKRKESRIVKVDDLTEWRVNRKGEEGSFPATCITASEWNFAVGGGAALFERLRSMPVRLADVTSRMYQGPITSADTEYLFKEFRAARRANTTEVFSQELKAWIALESAILKEVIRSGEIGRYRALTGALVLFPYEVKNCSARLFPAAEMHKLFPRAWEYLKENSKLLQNREKDKFKDSEWYRFGRNQNLGLWDQPKLMVPYMISELAAYFDRSDNYYFINVTTGGYGITSDETSGSLAYLCGLLNSRLLDFYFKQVSTTFHGGYFAANKQYIEKLPIHPINFSNPDDKARHEKMVLLVDRMQALHKRSAVAKNPNDKHQLQREIDATGREIDQIVYKLYELREEEIKLVEETTRL